MKGLEVEEGGRKVSDTKNTALTNLNSIYKVHLKLNKLIGIIEPAVQRDACSGKI